MFFHFLSLLLCTKSQMLLFQNVDFKWLVTLKTFLIEIWFWFDHFSCLLFWWHTIMRFRYHPKIRRKIPTNLVAAMNRPFYWKENENNFLLLPLNSHKKFTRNKQCQCPAFIWRYHHLLQIMKSTIHAKYESVKWK